MRQRLLNSSNLSAPRSDREGFSDQRIKLSLNLTQRIRQASGGNQAAASGHLLLIVRPPAPTIRVEQYLKAVFPGSVVSYRDTRDMETLPEPQPGTIFMFGNWKFPLLEHTTIDLLWNAASFQEMEPDVVTNYLSYVNDCASNVYLHEAMLGQGVAKARGSPGVLERTTLAHYQRGLPDFEMVDLRPARGRMGQAGTTESDSFWKRK